MPKLSKKSRNKRVSKKPSKKNQKGGEMEVSVGVNRRCGPKGELIEDVGKLIIGVNPDRKLVAEDFKKLGTQVKKNGCREGEPPTSSYTTLKSSKK